MRILIVEDEPDLLRTLVQAMREEGHAVDEAADGQEALYKATEWSYDAIILDVMLPGIDGFEILRRIRAIRSTPVLMLTARTKVDDRVHGLDSGADDYLSKPVDLVELSARVRAIVRRAQGSASSVLEVRDVRIDLASRRVTRKGEAVSLTGREYALIEALVLRRGKIVTRAELYDHLHDENDTPVSNLVDVHVFNLRRKLGVDFIVTHRGQGYSIQT